MSMLRAPLGVMQIDLWYFVTELEADAQHIVRDWEESSVHGRQPENAQHGTVDRRFELGQLLLPLPVQRRTVEAHEDAHFYLAWLGLWSMDTKSVASSSSSLSAAAMKERVIRQS